MLNIYVYLIALANKLIYNLRELMFCKLDENMKFIKKMPL